MVVLGCGDYVGYHFGKIELFIAENTLNPGLFVNEYETTDFDCLSHCYNFKQFFPKKFWLCELRDLLDLLPVDLIKTHGDMRIRLHYHILDFLKE
jgi:hypothetical protein